MSTDEKLDKLAAALESLTTEMPNLKTLVSTLVDKSEVNAQAVQRLEQRQPAYTEPGGARAPGGGHHYDRLQKYGKLDFPKYAGKDDPLPFLSRCESYFHLARIMKEEKVHMAALNLEDVAQMWYMRLARDEGTPSWRRFSELLNTRFGTLRNVPVGGGTRKKPSSSPPSYAAAAKPKKPSKKKRRLVAAAAAPPTEPAAFTVVVAAAPPADSDNTTAAVTKTAATEAATPTTTADAASEITTELLVPAAAAAVAEEEDSLAHLLQPDVAALGLGISDFASGKGLLDAEPADSFEWPAAFDLGSCWGGGAGFADTDPAGLFLNLP